MDPHEHYERAEQLLDAADAYRHDTHQALVLLASAQVHATLASVHTWPRPDELPRVYGDKFRGDVSL